MYFHLLLQLAAIPRLLRALSDSRQESNHLHIAY